MAPKKEEKKKEREEKKKIEKIRNVTNLSDAIINKIIPNLCTSL